MPALTEPRLASTSFIPTEEGLKMALAAAQAGIWEWHLDSNENIWSTEVWLLYGLSRDIPATYDAWLYSIHPEDRTYARQTIAAASQCRVPFEIEWRTNPALGTVRWLMSRGQPGKPRDNGQATYTGIVMDITARKKAEHAVLKLTETLEERVRERTAALSEHERLLQNILDGIPGLIGYWGKDLYSRFANRAYSEWFGLTPEELRNKHIKELLGAELYELNRPHIEAALSGQRQRFERQIPVPGRPGEVRHSEAHYLPDTVNGVVQGFLVIVFDISQIKQAELAAEAANQAKSEFLANISHEVRTPLNAMFGLAQVGARQAGPTPLGRTFEQILDSAQHLLTLVNDVLDFSKIESGKLSLHYERINLGQVLEHVLTLKAIRAQSKGLPLVVHESANVPQYFHGDATRISQILLNLLSNAIKFTERGQVTLTLDYVAPDMIMEVKDTGLGMTPDKLAQLFKPFVQVHGNHPLQTGGTGLGLAITKRLIDLMRGRIDVHSTAGQGTCFTVKLPLLHPEGAQVRQLGRVALLAPVDAQSEALHKALTCRHVPTQQYAHWPDITNQAFDMLIVDASTLSQCAPREMARLRQSGHTIVVNSPASTALAFPEGMPDDLPVLAGPLSPLRLLNAIKTRLAHPAASSPHRLEGIRILAAEDNPVNRLVLQQMLEQEGAIMSFAFDGAHALEQVRVQGPASFDLVLCDIQMPIMDGYQTAQALGHIAPSLPVIGLTAHAFDTAKQQARRAGMVGYVTKPYMLDTLVEEIRRFARRRPGDPPPSDDEPLTGGNTPEPSMQQDITDWQAMQQYFQSQPQLLDKLIGMLTPTLSAIQTELEQARMARNMDALAKVAHNIKGTALNLHTPELARLSVQTQEQARQQSDEALTTAETLSARLGDFIDMATRYQAARSQ
ncbi:MAG TPA: ATP-binding protein [Aquabacterium sp.]|uniref:ATP-binding protein n=1 Tax=Aquabacterium sp. TaxID=1872578 RepID=UPI002E30061C|nr:ATP-binding protein [Aquabacterium sp.]HEX5357863.1 ATP-binding protein [Aquabacterium sp.]